MAAKAGRQDPPRLTGPGSEIALLHGLGGQQTYEHMAALEEP